MVIIQILSIVLFLGIPFILHSDDIHEKCEFYAKCLIFEADLIVF